MLEKHQAVTAQNSAGSEGPPALNQALLQQLEMFVTSTSHPVDRPARDNFASGGSLQQGVSWRHTIAKAHSSKGSSAGGLADARIRGTTRAVTRMLTRGRSSDGSRFGGASIPGKIVRRKKPIGPGGLAPDDPFFWFASGNLALHTFPAIELPRKALQDNALDVLTLHYSDFASRSGTPEPGTGVPGASRSLGGRARSHRLSRATLGNQGTSLSFAAGGPEEDPGLEPIPPANCVHQPTELYMTRKRWEVKKEFADDRRMILGDTGWFPGAQGHRFTFEASAADVSLYVRLKEVPQAQLLYVLNTLLPPRSERPPAEQAAGASAPPAGSSAEADGPEHHTSSDSDVTEENDGPVGRWQREARRKKRRANERRAKAKWGQKAPEADDDVFCDNGRIGDVFGSVMLPAVMRGKGPPR